MAADVATLTLRADISELQRQLRSIPENADGQAKRMAVALERAFKRAEQASREAARNSAKAQVAAAKEAERAAEEARKKMGEGLKGFGELIGLPIDKIEKLGQAFGVAGGTFGAVAGGAALATLAIAGTAAAVFGLTNAAIEYEKEIGPLRDKGLLPPLDPTFAANLNEAEQAMAGAEIAAKAAAVQVGARLAPAVEYGAVVVAEIADAMTMAGDTFTAFGSALKSGVIVYLQTVADWGLAIPTIYANMAKVVGGALSALGMDSVGGKLTALADGFLDFKNSVGSGFVENFTTGLDLMGRAADIDGEKFRALGVAAEDANERQSKSAAKSTDASKAQAAADKERAAALDKIRGIALATEAASASAERKLGMAAAEQIRQLNEISEKYAEQPEIIAAASAAEDEVRLKLQNDLNDLRIEQDREAEAKRTQFIKQETEARMRAEQQVHDRRMSLAQGFFDSSIAFTRGVSDLLNATSKANAKRDRELALRQFKAAKAAGIAEATINGAVAITRALASLGPIAGPVAATGIAASTAAQIATIASQKPAFDRGGMIQGGAQMSDQVTIRALPGEAVLSRGAVRDLGGQSGVDRLNRGSAPSQNVVMVPVYKHFGRFVQDELQRSSVLQGAMLAGRPVGALGY
ncbi:hypothetical protein K0U83_04750 [bacterium]|nr:hypothetical protein [bacterium]